MKILSAVFLSPITSNQQCEHRLLLQFTYYQLFPQSQQWNHRQLFKTVELLIRRYVQIVRFVRSSRRSIALTNALTL